VRFVEQNEAAALAEEGERVPSPVPAEGPVPSRGSLLLPLLLLPAAALPLLAGVGHPRDESSRHSACA